nr:MAG TPA: hypothetical protein [Caudoviricetes sp.]
MIPRNTVLVSVNSAARLLRRNWTLVIIPPSANYQAVSRSAWQIKPVLSVNRI